METDGSLSTLYNEETFLQDFLEISRKSWRNVFICLHNSCHCLNRQIALLSWKALIFQKDKYIPPSRGCKKTFKIALKHVWWRNFTDLQKWHGYENWQLYFEKGLSTKWNNAYIKSRIHEAWLNKCAVITSILEQLCLSSEKQAS